VPARSGMIGSNAGMEGDWKYRYWKYISFCCRSWLVAGSTHLIRGAHRQPTACLLALYYKQMPLDQISWRKWQLEVPFWKYRIGDCVRSRFESCWEKNRRLKLALWTRCTWRWNSTLAWLVGSSILELMSEERRYMFQFGTSASDRRKWHVETAWNAWLEVAATSRETRFWSGGRHEVVNFGQFNPDIGDQPNILRAPSPEARAARKCRGPREPSTQRI